jgi:hypothetical protein
MLEEATAQRALSDIQPLPDNVHGEVQPVPFKGSHLYRALLLGFPSKEAALRYCENRHKSNDPCWVH